MIILVMKHETKVSKAFKKFHDCKHVIEMDTRPNTIANVCGMENRSLHHNEFRLDGSVG